ncbi:hypothetical protein K7W03_26555, partial [Sphingobium sp. PNB]|nr:hypothetical protein [Sphingobium sp. PNB]
RASLLLLQHADDLLFCEPCSLHSSVLPSGQTLIKLGGKSGGQVKQIGTGEVKGLFRLNATEIKDDVLSNVKSLDGDALVARIDEAMERGTWGDAKEVWEYIKSRRRLLPPELKDEDKETLQKFLEDSWNNGIFVLSRGALEDYLPAGFKGKDLEKLITFVESKDFWDNLPRDGRGEIEAIARTLLQIPPQEASADVIGEAAE